MSGPTKVVRARQFPTTEWSIVLSARGSTNPSSRAALARLCEDYWSPLYAYLRRRGHSPDEAQELTQSFFVSRLLEGNLIARVRPGCGRFRSYLLVSLKNFVANERHRARRVIDGDSRSPSHLGAAEIRYLREPKDDLTPEEIYEQRWARTLLLRVLGRLRSEFVRSGRLTVFERLKGHLPADSLRPRYVETARALGLSEGAVKVMVHRLRRRYRTLLFEEVARTVASEHEIEDELRYLRAVLHRHRGAKVA